MRRYRHLLFPLIVFILLMGFAAEINAAQAFICTPTTSPPVFIRQEGLAEMVTDLIIDCVGGVPGVQTANAFVI